MLAGHESFLHVSQFQVVQRQHVLLLLLLKPPSDGMSRINEKKGRFTCTTHPHCSIPFGKTQNYLLVFKPGQGLGSEDKPVVLGPSLHDTDVYVEPASADHLHTRGHRFSPTLGRNWLTPYYLNFCLIRRPFSSADAPPPPFVSIKK